MSKKKLDDKSLSYFGNPDIMNLGEIIRYNNRPKIRKENVSEHSFYVATNVLRICRSFGIDYATKCVALEMAVVHDIPETFLGDIPYITKRDNPKLCDALEKAELEQLQKNMPEFYNSYKNYVVGLKAGEVAPTIVKLADVISVLQYSNNEIEIGNTSKAMVVINEDAKKRVEQFTEKLTKAIKERRISIIPNNINF